MERLQKLTDTIAAIDKTSKEILSKMLPIMERIDNVNDDIIDEIVYRTKLDPKQVVEYVQSITVEMIDDAETVSKEINAFTSAVTKGKQKILENVNQYPFLGNVWHGDTYDEKQGIVALEELLKELKSTHDHTNDNWIIEKCVKDLKATK